MLTLPVCSLCYRGWPTIWGAPLTERNRHMYKAHVQARWRRSRNAKTGVPWTLAAIAASGPRMAPQGTHFKASLHEKSQVLDGERLQAKGSQAKKGVQLMT